MKSLVKSFGIASIVGLILVLPLVILEAVNNTITRQNLPGLTLLFGLMWLLPTIFMMVLLPMVREVRNRDLSTGNVIRLILQVTSLVLIAAVWGWGLADQAPCVLGIPNCD